MMMMIMMVIISFSAPFCPCFKRIKENVAK